jgi:transposase-like protein
MASRALGLFVALIQSQKTPSTSGDSNGGLEVYDAKRLRELEKENARLKRLLAESAIEIDAMKEVLARKW